MFDESKHPRDSDGKFTDGTADYKYPQYLSRMSGRDGRQEEEPHKEKMTPAAKIASVHIDLNKDNILPELNEEDLKKIGVDKNKPVLLKKDVIDRNRNEHPDVSKEDMEKIVGNALYSPSNIFSANTEKPNYFHFASFVELSSKGKPKIGMTLLDVDAKKDCFEIVHMYYVGLQGLQRAIEKTIKKD